MSKGLSILFHNWRCTRQNAIKKTVTLKKHWKMLNQIFLINHCTLIHTKYLQKRHFFRNFLQNRRSPSLLFFIHLHGGYDNINEHSNLTLSAAICVKYPLSLMLSMHNEVILFTYCSDFHTNYPLFLYKNPFSESLKCTNSTSTLRLLKLYEKPYTVKSIKYSRTHWLEQSRMSDDFRRCNVVVSSRRLRPSRIQKKNRVG